MTSPAARSRWVDRRYRVPSPISAWRQEYGKGPDQQIEEAYVDSLLNICARERIDFIFPSWDPEIYLLAKHQDRFAELGVNMPVPSYDAVRMPLDKFLTIEAAKASGVLCPETRVPTSPGCLTAIASELRFPLIIKPRATSGGYGMKIVTRPEQLSGAVASSGMPFGTFLLQEYVPGGQHEVLRLILDKAGTALLVFSEKRWRTFGRFMSKMPTVAESLPVQPYAVPVIRMLQKVGWWGPVNAEFVVDPRDGIPRLLEINPRLGGHHWHVSELGINTPQMCLDVARGEPVKPVTEYPAHTLFIDPVEDVMGFFFRVLDRILFNIRTGLFRRPAWDPGNPPMKLMEILAAYKASYRRGRVRVWSPVSRNIFKDPQVAMCWWLQVSTWIFGAFKQLGK